MQIDLKQALKKRLKKEIAAANLQVVLDALKKNGITTMEMQIEFNRLNAVTQKHIDNGTKFRAEYAQHCDDMFELSKLVTQAVDRL